MGIPVKVSMYNVGTDMKPTGKAATTELGPMDSEQFVRIMGQIFEVTPKDWASGYSPPSFMLECPSGVQGFHIWKGKIKHFQSDRFVELGEVRQIIESPPKAAAPRVRDAKAIDTSGPQLSFKGWKSDVWRTLFIVALAGSGICLLAGLIFIPLLLLVLLGVPLAFVLRAMGRGEIKAGFDKEADAIWVQRPGQEMDFESRASEILGFKVEVEVESGPYRPDHHHHTMKVMGVKVVDEVHEEPHHPPPQVKTTWWVKAKRADYENLQKIKGGACITKSEANQLAQGLEGLVRRK